MFYAFGQFFIDVNGLKMKDNLAIWSHWWSGPIVPLYYLEHTFDYWM